MVSVLESPLNVYAFDLTASSSVLESITLIMSPYLSALLDTKGDTDEGDLLPLSVPVWEL